MEEDFKGRVLELIKKDMDVKEALADLIFNVMNKRQDFGYEDRLSGSMIASDCDKMTLSDETNEVNLKREECEEKDICERKEIEGKRNEDIRQSEKETYLKEIEEACAEKNSELEAKEKELEWLKKDNVSKDKFLEDAEYELEEREKKISAQDFELQELRRMLDEKAKIVKKLMEKEKALSAVIEEKEEVLEKKDSELKEVLKKYIEENKKKEELCKQYEGIKQKYQNLEEIFDTYLKLGEPIIQRMERILNSSEEATSLPEVFMAYGAQENNILALWESIATNVDFYDSQGKTEDLVGIFYYFLKVYKEITFKEVQIMWPEEGDSYDERKHTRTASSNAVGRIHKVILPGFSIGRNITKKSLVIVK